ncbi:MAG: flagellar hook protein FlgE [Aliivibrio sp.]|uniref:flagellar hook protein FlgE n=1 Tax=Aliivibrio sp. TaxID=1872443 RepID=UPI001A523B48|nr:flagellar hook protein FlgE [Aliivibrio sp.]
MSYVSLSGLAAAQKDLKTTSNNIANANTYGFKESRAEFGDVYSTSLFSNAKTTTGGGANTSIVAQQFHEGSSIYTNNPMDLRIAGQGFFAVAKNRLQPATNELTRNGAFHLDKDNYMVTSDNQSLLGYEVDKDSGEVTSYEPKAIKVPDQFGKPKQSENVEIGLNLPSNAPAKDVALFDPNDPDTYNKSTSITVYDSKGQPYKMTTYYVKDATKANTWSVYYTGTDAEGEKTINIAGGDASSATGHVGHTLEFNHDGTPKVINAGQPIITESLGEASAMNLNGADPAQILNMKFDTPTQYAAPFEMRRFNEDGATTGYLAKVDIDERGNIVGSYSNGQDVTLGRIATVRVANMQGLSQQGGTQWQANQKSGAAVWGEANQGSFGAIQSGTIEQSNIDMTQELVDLITAQRNFQANSRSLEVHNQLQQNILQIR